MTRRFTPYAAAIATFVLAVHAHSTPREDKIIRVGTDKIPDEYIVVLEDGVVADNVPTTARMIAAAHGTEPLRVWSNAIKAFLVRVPESVAAQVSRHPLVKYVEENAPWYPAASPQRTNVDVVTCDPNSATSNCTTVTDNRLWHLDRTDQDGAPPNNEYRYCGDSNVTVYVINGGVNKHHQEFAPTATRTKAVLAGYNATADGMPADDPCLGFALPATDGLERTLRDNEINATGHGTSVASVIGGNRAGVAKNVTIVPIKVIRCDRYSARYRKNSTAYQLHETIIHPSNASSELYRAVAVIGPTASSDPGGWSGTSNSRVTDGGVTWENVSSLDYNKVQSTDAMIAGIDWILSEQNTSPRSHAVVNISTGRVASWTKWSGVTPSVEASVEALLANNLTVVASANNQNGNACDTTPALMSDRGVITVGGSMIRNRPWNAGVAAELDPSPQNFATIEAQGTEADRLGVEPAFDPKKPVLDARWICGPGDTSKGCNNGTSETASGDPTMAESYHVWQGGSNAGPCVTLFAPAKNVAVASPAASDAYRDPHRIDAHASGTSWSAPMVAAAAALILHNNPLTPVQVRDELVGRSAPALDPLTLNTYASNGTVITGTPNRLLRLGDVRITNGPTGAASATGTVLSVRATGATLTYEWFRVNSDFDANATRGAHPTLSSTRVGTASTYTVTQPGRYWVRVTGTCGSADSDIIPAAVSPPTGLAARAITQTTIALSWTASSQTGAAYRIRYRTAITAAWLPLADTTLTTFNHTGATAGMMYEYELVAKDSTGNTSPPITDYAIARTFTDDLISGETVVKGVHIGELREAVDAWRGFTNLADAFPSYAAATGVVYASHWTELTTAFNAARTRLGLPAFSYDTLPAPARSVVIRLEHVKELRTVLQ